MAYKLKKCRDCKKFKMMICNARYCGDCKGKRTNKKKCKECDVPISDRGKGVLLCLVCEESREYTEPLYPTKMRDCTLCGEPTSNYFYCVDCHHVVEYGIDRNSFISDEEAKNSKYVKGIFNNLGKKGHS